MYIDRVEFQSVCKPPSPCTELQKMLTCKSQGQLGVAIFLKRPTESALKSPRPGKWQRLSGCKPLPPVCVHPLGVVPAAWYLFFQERPPTFKAPIVLPCTGPLAAWDPRGPPAPGRSPVGIPPRPRRCPLSLAATRARFAGEPAAPQLPGSEF